MFATTPGGTRIIYDRSFLLECRNSPLARSPLTNLPKIPGVTCPNEKSGSPKSPKTPSNLLQEQKPNQRQGSEEEKPTAAAKAPGGAAGDDPQFEMDI
jgi:hypothetical protein